MLKRIIAKTPYYFSSFFTLYKKIKNPSALLYYLLWKNAYFDIDAGVRIKLSLLQLIDFLVIKETILDDVYHLNQIISKKPFI